MVGNVNEKLTIKIKRVRMFRTRVTAAAEELEHFHRCPAENQLSKAQNGDFVKELIGQQMVLVCNQVSRSLWKKVSKQSVLQ